MKTLQQLAREALDVQNACSLSGVSQSFAKAVLDLRAVLREANGGNPPDTLTVNHHPIVRVWLSKLDSLAGGWGSLPSLEDWAKVEQWAEGRGL